MIDALLDTSFGRREVHLWLRDEGLVVSHVHALVDRDEVTVLDIETRPGFRRRGYAKVARSLLAEVLGVDRLMSTGVFTVAGFAAFGADAHLLPGAHFDVSAHEAQSWVADWDRPRARGSKLYRRRVVGGLDPGPGL